MHRDSPNSHNTWTDRASEPGSDPTARDPDSKRMICDNQQEESLGGNGSNFLLLKGMWSFWDTAGGSEQLLQPCWHQKPGQDPVSGKVGVAYNKVFVLGFPPPSILAAPPFEGEGGSGHAELPGDEREALG